VDADQGFGTFLAQWTQKRIWRVGDVLSDVDQQYLAEKRSIELIQLALEKGFSSELTEIAQRYGSVLDYVKALYSKANNGPRLQQ
jgi:hypothetical protein